MIQSTFIANIVDLLLDGDSLGQTARPQKEYLVEKEYNYTGVGVFVSFDRLEGFEKFKVDNEGLFLNGVVIKSKELNEGAEAMLFFADGFIDYLEIWSYDGEYPTKELATYALKQEWPGSSGREITVE